jgi:hypothetical protein
MAICMSLSGAGEKSMVYGFSAGEFGKTIGIFAIVQAARDGRTFPFKPQPRFRRPQEGDENDLNC